MDWKNNLGKLMVDNNHYKLDLLNEQLSGWCKEWTIFVNEFDGNRAELGSERKEYSGSFITPNLIKVYDKENLSLFPFKAYLYFVSQDRKLTLYIATTERFNNDPDAFLRTRDRESDDKYFWHSENEISDAEITEQGFVLQLLNNRLGDYLNSFKQTGV
jgi:hypothetical protein